MAGKLKVMGVHFDERRVLVDGTTTPPTYATRTITTVRVVVTDVNGDPVAPVLLEGMPYVAGGLPVPLPPIHDLILLNAADANGIDVGDMIPIVVPA